MVDLPATVWDIDFNPGVDRLRVVSQSGLNFRMNPNTGAGVDGDGGVAGVNMDGSINGGTTALRGAAYTNNQPQNGFDASTTTSLYTFDGQGVYLQNPPNSGTQVLLINPRFAIQNVRGFDLPPGADAAFPNGQINVGRGLFASDSGSGTTIVWDIELNSGVFQPDPRFLVEFPGSVRSLCVRTTLDAFVALEAAGTTLHRFRPLSAGTSVTATISGVTAGETLVSIAGRPQTGQLYGFGVDATADTGTLYLLDPQTGAATAVGVPGAIAFVDASGNPVDLPDSGTGYGMDFNPTVDRVRIVTGSGLNFRLNPTTGGAVDGNLGSAAIVAGTNPDGALNGGSTVATATAYTNSFAQSLTGGVTTQYAYNSRTGSVFIQNPPNAGTLGFAFSISFFDFFAPAAMDIPANVSVSASGSAATGNAWVITGRPANTLMYRLDLGTGASTQLGFFAGSQASGLVAWSAAPNLSVEQPAGTAVAGSVSFGTTPGAPATRTFTLRNTGSQPLTYSANTNFSAAYSITQNETGIVPASGSATLVVSYSPKVAGAEETNLVIRSDDPQQQNLSIQLTGPGVQALTDDEAVTTTGTTRLHVLANDGFDGTITSVSDANVVIEGRTLILPNGYTGTFTYTVSNATATGVGNVTVTAGTPAIAPTKFNGLLTAADGKVSGWADVSLSAKGVAVAKLLVGTTKATKKLTFPTGVNAISGTLNFGKPATVATLLLDRSTAGIIEVTFTTADAKVFTGTMHAAAAPVLAVQKHHIALASIDSAIPGGGFAIASVSKKNAVKLVGVLPDGHAFTVATTRTDDGGIAFYGVDKKSKPAATFGGTLTPADLATTDVTGELVWSKPAQLPTVKGIHLLPIDTALTANGSLFTGLAPLLTGAGTLNISGGNLAADQTGAATISALGIPGTLPLGALTAWTGVKQKVGKFSAKVTVPTLTKPVSAKGIYLPKSNRAWGFFPGTTVGGSIELTVP